MWHSDRLLTDGVLEGSASAWFGVPIVEVHECITVLSQAAHGSVVGLYKAPRHVAKWFKNFRNKSLVCSGLRVKGLELDVYWYDRGLGCVVEEGVVWETLIGGEAGNKALSWRSVPLNAESPASEISVV